MTRYAAAPQSETSSRRGTRDENAAVGYLGKEGERLPELRKGDDPDRDRSCDEHD